MDLSNATGVTTTPQPSLTSHLSQFIQAQIQKKSKQIIRQLLSEFSDNHERLPGVVASSREKLYYIHKLTGMPMPQIKAFIRYLQDKPGRLTHNTKHLIEDYTRSNIGPRTHPTSEQLDELQLITNLSRNQVRKQVERLLDPPQKITLTKKRNLYSDLLKNNLTDYITFSSDVWNRLKREHDLSRYQIRTLMKRRMWTNYINSRRRNCPEETINLDAPPHITDNQKNQIFDLLHATETLPEYSPELLDTIQFRVKPRVENREELSRFVRYYLLSRKPITKEVNHIVREALEENQMQILKGDAMDVLIQRTGIDRPRLFQIMLRMTDLPLQSLNRDSKQSIEEWIRGQCDLNEMHPREIIAKVREEFRLPRNQVLSILRRIRDPTQKLTDEKRNLVREWLLENNFRKPSGDEYEAIAQRSELSKMQVYKLVNVMRKKVVSA
mmetsp:Transcript_11067/g.41280  ORF Transcript_11067/g.41280 Transcript_11067/m.41280 type:complete len:440 (-) Transcript_11067:1404-2723(-)